MAQNTALPIDYAAIRKAIVRELQSFTGLTVIQQEIQGQNNPRPPLPYLSYKLVTPGIPWGDDTFSSRQIGSGDEERTQYSYGGQRSILVSLQCYGTSQEEAYGYMSLVQAKLQDETILMNLRRESIAVWDLGSVADLSQMLNTGYEGRAQMDVTFGVAANLESSLSTIETAIITGEVDEEEFELTVPEPEE